MQKNQGLPLTFEILELVEDLPGIEDGLPFPFESGRCLDEVEVHCAACEQEIPLSKVRGPISMEGKNNLDAGFDGLIICSGCKSIIPMSFRIQNDGNVWFRQGELWIRLKVSQPQG